VARGAGATKSETAGVPLDSDRRGSGAARFYNHLFSKNGKPIAISH
jgi:hypothetical protein